MLEAVAMATRTHIVCTRLDVHKHKVFVPDRLVLAVALRVAVIFLTCNQVGRVSLKCFAHFNVKSVTAF